MNHGSGRSKCRFCGWEGPVPRGATALVAVIDQSGRTVARNLDPVTQCPKCGRPTLAVELGVKHAPPPPRASDDYGPDARLDGLPPPLAGAVLKLRRAKKHLDDLDWLAGNWAGLFTDPVHSYDEASGRYVVELAPDPPADTEDFGLLVGDFAHNLRTALDHLVYALADYRKIAAPGGHSGFLLRDTEPEFDRDATNRISKRSGKQVRSPLDGLNPTDIDAFKSVQPFQPLADATGGDRDEIWQTGTLRHPLVALTLVDNFDKHRVIHATAIRVRTSGKIQSRSRDIRGVQDPRPSDALVAIGERAEIFSATLVGAGPTPRLVPACGFVPVWTEWFLSVAHFKSMYEVVVRVVKASAKGL